MPKYWPTIEQMKHNGEWPIGWMSGKGLIPIIQSLGDNVVGCELGVMYGWNLFNTLDNCSNIKMVWAIDPYTDYVWEGPEEYMHTVRDCMLYNMKPFQDRYVFVNKTSEDAANIIPDNGLDYIFIDADHSYEWVKKDLAAYYSKVKSGGLVAGHDYSWASVVQALEEFLSEQQLDKSILQLCDTDAWYFIKP